MKVKPATITASPTLLLIIFLFTITSLTAKEENPESSIDKRALVENAVNQSEVFIKNGKIKKAISTIEGVVAEAKSLNDEFLLEKIYTSLIELNTNLKNKKKVEEYQSFLNFLRAERENRLLKSKTAQEEMLIEKITHEKEEITREERKIELENQLTKEQLKTIDSELHLTRDSMSMLDLINLEKQTEINLLNKEKELNDLKVKEQQLIIKEKEEAQELTEVIIGSLLFGLLTVGSMTFIIHKNSRQRKSYSEKIESQLNTIKHQHESIRSSINYAQRIQNAMLPSETYLHQILTESFILFKPKDVVSGDFYWVYDVKDKANDKTSKTLIAAVDCTGHGVPGAFMSMIGHNSLNAIASKGIYSPDQILSELNTSIRATLQQHQNNNNDGMDMALCLIDRESRTIEFAGAKNPFILIKNGQLEIIKGDKHPIGGSQGEAERRFTKHVISIDQPTSIYLLSDGYEDQFGGPENRKFMIKNLKGLLLQIHQEPFEKQKAILEETIDNWKGKDGKQIDDILVLGMRVQ